MQVLNTLVEFGAPEDILREGKPHIGTDRLVRLLRRFRDELHRLGADVRFGARVEEVLLEGGRAAAVRLADGAAPPWPPLCCASWRCAMQRPALMPRSPCARPLDRPEVRCPATFRS